DSLLGSAASWSAAQVHEGEDFDARLLEVRFADAIEDAVREMRHAALVHVRLDAWIGARPPLQLAQRFFEVLQQVLREPGALAPVEGSSGGGFRPRSAVPANVDQAYFARSS